jgi:dihydrolipoamide dehydrogenase
LRAHGITVGEVGLDLAAMMKRKDAVVRGLTRGVAGLFRKHKIEWVKGSGRITSPSSVAVEGAEALTLTAARILIATGSVPINLPELPFDGSRILSSTEALSLAAVPRQLLIVGGGAIGLELGSVWRRLGAEVLVVELMERIVPGMDGEMAKALQKELEKQGIKFRLGTRVKRAEVVPTGVHAVLDHEVQETEVTSDIVLVAVGRQPYTEGLGLEDVGVKLDERRRIIVDELYATTVPGIFAIGDVLPGPMLAHKAEEEGIAAVELMAGLPGHVNYDAIPNVVYTWPELASVGMATEDAQARGREVRVGTFPFQANGRAKCMNETMGLVKVVADAKTDQVLGLHILGPHASELIAEAALAMEFFASAEDIARSVHAHPTLAEAVKEASLAVAGRTLNY